MSLHVIVGAGPTGSATARLLAEDGERVRVVTRRGLGPEHPLIERVAADASDAERLAELVDGATTLYNCAAPSYDRVPVEVPPLAASLLAAAERSGAGLLNLSNGYGYGPWEGAATEATPLAPTTIKGRVLARVWHQGVAAHEAGRVRFAEVRPGDFLGPGAVSMFSLMIAPPLLAGDEIHFPADPDAPHSWGYPGDVGRTLATLGRDERTWGRAWHVPNISDAPVREIATRFAALAGAPEPRLVNMAPLDLHHAGLADPVMAQVWEMQYLYQRPAVMDASHTARTFGLAATDLEEVLKLTADALLADAPRAAARPD
ncbi:NAD-dependent epimerase/dehydratase family protein [Streptomyces sp. 4N509B]|uniref:NAD-dependent epimerase/dehydratase family protein n=1 Tax=Streptomyces sp. 4N509B TaxID=3457413 RepID=UPI003FCFF2C5